MPHTGVYFIPSSPNAPNILGPLTERLRSIYGDEVVPFGRWGLEHKLMKDTPSCLPASAHAPNPAPRPRYMHFLSTTNYPKVGFIYASSDTPRVGSEMVMSPVPITSSAELFRHFVRACEPLWCHRHTVTVTGAIYDVGDFRVRLGEVRQTQPQARPRGTIMEVEWKGPSVIASAGALMAVEDGLADIEPSVDISYVPTEEEVNAEYADIAQLIREFWARLAIQDKTARESILVPDLGKEVKERFNQRRQPGWYEREAQRRQKRLEALLLDRSWGGVSSLPEKEDDMDTGVDLARQYMELFRFNR
ncbi:mediator complex, subunit Med20 [Talaromyces proteolyticus]|uniref:Mediator of RNA polymerase II transcription subunit 20 n=1 Tax=Talaromyces proteolyticus TaxID=1131652 RepID=A0AAD4KZ17_9EURO|nr:mediator complex, subunit Med20 [Talaromyces proteolyticus]KAH8704155.1 mediator complex, subunit Med20 [Talaromyces proteolyticus]